MSLNERRLTRETQNQESSLFSSRASRQKFRDMLGQDTLGKK